MDRRFTLRNKIASLQGMTLVEILVGLAVIGLFASSSLWGLVMMNNKASVARLFTGAQTVAQNQLDLMLCDMPYNPQKNQVPTELTAGTQTQSNVPIYTDPTSNNVVVAGTVTTTVADTGMTYGGYSLNTYSITVTVSYQYRNKTYQVVLNSLRTSDV